MKGFTKRFLAVMIAVSVLSQAGIAAFAADTGLSYKGPDAVSDLSAGTMLQERKAAPEDVGEGSAQAYFENYDTITVEDEEVSLKEDSSSDWNVLNGGYLEITNGTVSGNIDVSDGGTVSIFGDAVVTGAIWVYSGGVIAINGTVNDVFIYEGAEAMVTDDSQLEKIFIPEGYAWHYDEDYGYYVLTAPEVPAAEIAEIAETEEKYTSLEDALDAAVTGQTVKLLDYTEVHKGIAVETGITLDLNGNELYVEGTLTVTGKIVDYGNTRGSFTAGHIFMSRNTGSEFPIYNSATGCYSLYDLAVTSYDDTQTKVDDLYGFRLTKNSDRAEATALINEDDEAGCVEARVVISWKENEDGKEKTIEKTIAYDSDFLKQHAANPGHVILTFKMKGIDTVNGSITATPMFVTKDTSGNVIAEIKGDTLTVKE